MKQLRHPPLKPDAIGYTEFYNRSHDAVIHVYDESGNVIQTHEHKGDFKAPRVFTRITLHFPLKEVSRDSAFIK